MTASSPAGPRIRFDAFEADLHTEELFLSGRRIRLPNQSFRVLAMLLEKAGRLVTREELRARLWPPGKFVEYDQALNTAVNRLREALRDSADAPRFIETLPKRGYRFIAAVQLDLPPSDPVEPDVPGVEADGPGASGGGETVPAARANTKGAEGAEGAVTTLGPTSVTREPAIMPRRPWRASAWFAAMMTLALTLFAAGFFWLRPRPSANQAPSE